MGINSGTATECGGAGIYVKSCYDFDIKNDLSRSITDVTESLFIELKRDGLKNLMIGCIYRHHTLIQTFINEYFKNALDVVNKQTNKICVLMGDFNVDLIKYASETNTGDFYDLLCSHSFRPLMHSLVLLNRFEMPSIKKCLHAEFSLI